MDWEILSIAVNDNISHLYDCENLEFIKEIISKNGMNILHCSNKYKTNRDLILHAIKHENEGKLFYKLVYYKDYNILIQNNNVEFIINDYEIVMESIKRNGLNLEYSGKLKNDIEIVKLACQENHHSLLYATNEIKSNRLLIMELLDLNVEIFQYCNFKNDKEINLKTMKKQGNLYKYSELKDDYEIMMEAINQNGFVLYNLKDEFKNCKEIVMKAISNRGTSLQYASDELKNDRNLVLTAIKQNGQAIKYASNELQYDEELIREALKNNCPKYFIKKEIRNKF